MLCASLQTFNLEALHTRSSRECQSTHIVDFKSAYISLIIGPRGSASKSNPSEVMGWESSDVVRFDLRPLLQGQTRNDNFKVLITHLLVALQVCNVKPTFRKPWAGNLLMWSDLNLGLSFKIKRGEPNLKVLITLFLLVLELCNVK